MMQNPLKTIVKEACFSVTGSDPFVLRSTMKYAKDHDAYFICEATVNQVNQFGRLYRHAPQGLRRAGQRHCSGYWVSH